MATLARTELLQAIGAELNRLAETYDWEGSPPITRHQGIGGKLQRPIRAAATGVLMEYPGCHHSHPLMLGEDGHLYVWDTFGSYGRYEYKPKSLEDLTKLLGALRKLA